MENIEYFANNVNAERAAIQDLLRPAQARGGIRRGARPFSKSNAKPKPDLPGNDRHSSVMF